MTFSRTAHQNSLGFLHRWAPCAEPGAVQHVPTLLLLHGTGGDENDLLPLGRTLLPTANLLSPRGNTLEQGMPRFFRRLAEGVFDQEDLERQTVALGEFVVQAATTYGFDPRRVIAVGYSNGANIAGSLLLRQPDRLAAAVLFHPMTPFVPDALPEMQGKPIFIGAGENDPIVPVANTDQLQKLLIKAGAEVETYWHRAGHQLTGAEVETARRWLEGHSSRL